MACEKSAPNGNRRASCAEIPQHRPGPKVAEGQKQRRECDQPPQDPWPPVADQAGENIITAERCRIQPNRYGNQFQDEQKRDPDHPVVDRGASQYREKGRRRWIVGSDRSGLALEKLVRQEGLGKIPRDAGHGGGWFERGLSFFCGPELQSAHRRSGRLRLRPMPDRSRELLVLAPKPKQRPRHRAALEQVVSSNLLLRIYRFAWLFSAVGI